MSRLNRKRGRPTDYRKSLQKNPYWEKVKRKVRIRDKFQCVLCFTKTLLETHHLTYKIKGISILGKELEYLFALITLCESCHSKVHKDPKHSMNPKNWKD